MSCATDFRWRHGFNSQSKLKWIIYTVLISDGNWTGIDSSLVVSMEINDVMYQGVLFALQQQQQNGGGSRLSGSSNSMWTVETPVYCRLSRIAALIIIIIDSFSSSFFFKYNRSDSSIFLPLYIQLCIVFFLEWIDQLSVPSPSISVFFCRIVQLWFAVAAADCFYVVIILFDAYVYFRFSV